MPVIDCGYWKRMLKELPLCTLGGSAKGHFAAQFITNLQLFECEVVSFT